MRNAGYLKLLSTSHNCIIHASIDEHVDANDCLHSMGYQKKVMFNPRDGNKTHALGKLVMMSIYDVLTGLNGYVLH